MAQRAGCEQIKKGSSQTGFPYWTRVCLQDVLLGRIHANARLSVPQLLDSDQELYKNFPLVISERWQQEVAETVYEAVNSDTDKNEARKRAKNKQLGHEEGNESSSEHEDAAQRNPMSGLRSGSNRVCARVQTTLWGRTA